MIYKTPILDFDSDTTTRQHVVAPTWDAGNGSTSAYSHGRPTGVSRLVHQLPLVSFTS